MSVQIPSRNMKIGTSVRLSDAHRNGVQQHYHLHCEVCQQFYSISTLAAMWDMSSRTIKRMIQSGKLKAKRINGSVRIAHSELLRAIDEA